MNGPDGEAVVADYFTKVEAFEHPGPARTADPTVLGHALDFDDADLDSNRAGLISPAQRARLWRRDILQLVGASVCLIAGIAFNVALLAGWMTAHGRGAVLGVALMALGVVIGAASAFLWLDLAGGQVTTIEGELRTNSRITRSGTVYSIAIGTTEFNVSRATYDHIEEGTMRVYYLRRSQTLLSLEPVG